MGTGGLHVSLGRSMALSEYISEDLSGAVDQKAWSHSCTDLRQYRDAEIAGNRELV